GHMFEMGGVVGGGSGLLDALTAAVDALLAADHRDGSLVDLVADIAGLHTQEQRLAAVKLAMIRTCDADSGHHLAGHATTGTMLTDGLHLAPGQGQAMVKTARLLATTFGATAQALEHGLISYPHAAAITRAHAKLPADRLPDAEPLLLDVAAAGSPAMVRAAVDRMAELLEPDHHDQEDQDTRARRYLNVSATLDGWWAVDGHLPPEAGQRLTAALDEFAGLADPTDLRTAGQRRADAIAEIADAAADGHTTGITAVTITADAAHLDGAGATFDATGMPVGLSTYDLAVCQTRLTLLVTQRAGIGWQPLAVGRLNRYATAAQRAALHHRDGGCIYRGCTRPARRCHAHHIIDWRAGGLTDLPNLVLLCPYHHRMIHLARATFIDDPTTPGRHIAIPTRRHTTTAA
ncbi:MAG: DUF222 domain-containing protein, partial [Solirubrobacterales bacterium]